MWVKEEIEEEIYFDGRYVNAIIFFKYTTESDGIGLYECHGHHGFDHGSEYISDWYVEKVLIEEKVFKFDDLEEDTKGSVDSAIRRWAEDWEPCRWSFDYE